MLVGLIIVAVVGCQGGATNNTVSQGQGGQQATVDGPKVLFFSAEW